MNPDYNTLFFSFSQKEKELFELVLKGITNQEIATSLGLSLPSVKKRIQGMCTKLNVPNKTRLIAVYYRYILDYEEI